MTASKKITITIPVAIHTITAERIADLIDTGWDGGIDHWADSNKPHGEAGSIVVNGGSFELWDMEDSEGPRGTVSLATCERAFRIMANLEPLPNGSYLPLRHWNAFLTENEDADTGDVFLQLAALGDVVFG